MGFSSISRILRKWDKALTAEASILPDMGASQRASESSIGSFVQTCAAHLQDLDRVPWPRQAIPLLTGRARGRGGINTWHGDADTKGVTESLCGFDPPAKGAFWREKQAYLDPRRTKEPLAETSVCLWSITQIVGRGTSANRKIFTC